MFQRLKQKWNVNGTQLFLILCVFAVTGTTTAWLTRQATMWLQLDASSFWYWAVKIGILLFGYQILILLFSIPFGQFNFFWKYEKKILQRMKLIGNSSTDNANSPNKNLNVDINNMQTINVAIFASGAGSNAQKLIDYFRQHTQIKIALIVCNKPGAGVLTIAEKENIPTLLIEKEQFFRGNAYVDEIKQHNVDFIVLAGFLWKVPVALIQAFPQRIINIHPALLPNYGGKGMYGRFVHEAVIAAKEKESGISIHYVDELYDHGKLIFQARCVIDEKDNADSLAQKIHALEHEHYPLIVEKVIRELQNRR
ncbi:phosphoribosylglycinamide formyltransferase [Longitalea luteola]|uniref:phosphoribosylglycinamide formyltransferase n=1 Tax=Longitalea luteola TaxID=2812563 RepID=UPI001F600DB8|nr:phosphoribosylglycinamide formyltransferase [Longitalea luteola]